jgi:hypothetical protein
VEEYKLQVSENEVQWKTAGPNKDEVQLVI